MAKLTVIRWVVAACLSWGLACHSTAASPALVQAARAQVGKTLIYDPRYQSLTYPNGDVPILQGVCTDVVIRALRHAYKVDLQQQVHEDMRQRWATYPKLWGSNGPDANIDHRRVPNLQVFFQHKGMALPVGEQNADYQAGDIVTVRLANGRPHIMLVSDRKSASGRPLVIHNIGFGAREEDYLFQDTITGHYRWRLAR
ncbi:DUF1287 domain-containing protein [Leeia aquatica]|uniref:DUF1287 domain-containing protein n=1 Tax=Leeia aquatica TaxID=2725557 RepID=A0A847S7Y6_9NEIS|nr:DUF1287 domain-containing protein [Leeia aquatica]NLR76064.1 DUF1287 domain-containing protein [Leeia aquatica]